MAPCNGTTSTPKLVVTLPNHSTLQWHPTMAPSNGTLVPRPIPQSGSSPSPPIGSKNPYSYRYLGKKDALSLYIRVEARWKVFFSHHNAGANCISMIPKAEVHGFWWFPLWFWRPVCWRNFPVEKYNSWALWVVLSATSYWPCSMICWRCIQGEGVKGGWKNRGFKEPVGCYV